MNFEFIREQTPLYIEAAKLTLHMAVIGVILAIIVGLVCSMIKYFRIPVSVSLNAFDMLILIMQVIYNPPERVLYGILLVLVYTTVLDKVLMMGSTKTEVKIISSQVEEIRQAILAQVDRGVTMLYGEGGYRQEQTQIVLSIVSNRELPQVEKLIRQIDPEAFMIVSRVTEVRGRGFSLSKHYGEEQENGDAL